MLAYPAAPLTQAANPFSLESLRGVALDYLSVLAPEQVFWGLLGFGVVALVLGVVLTVRLGRAARTSAKALYDKARHYVGQLAEQRREEAAADSDRLKILKRIDQLRSQDWRSRYAKLHLVLCLGTSGWGIALAAEQHASMSFPANLLAVAAFEGLAVAVMLRIEDHANRGLPHRSYTALYWVAIGTAAAVQTTHVSHPVGQVIWVGFTLSGGLHFALHMAGVRADQEERLREAEGRRRNRHIAPVRWLRFAETVRVFGELAADPELGVEEATVRVRTRAAERRRGRALNRVMWAVWRLRKVTAAAGTKPTGRRVRQVERCTARTQRAIAHAELHASTEDLASLLRRLEAMDLAPRLAGMRSRSDARLIFGSFAHGGVGGAPAAGMVLGQFALEPGRGATVRGPEAEAGPDPVRVVFVGSAGSESAGSESTREDAVRRADSSAGGEASRVIDSEGESPRFEVAQQGESDRVELPLEEEASRVVDSGVGSVRGGPGPVRLGPTRGAGVEQGAGASEEGWAEAFEHADTPQQRILPLVEPEAEALRVEATQAEPNRGSVRRFLTAEELREELRKALREGRLSEVRSGPSGEVLGLRAHLIW